MSWQAFRPPPSTWKCPNRKIDFKHCYTQTIASVETKKLFFSNKWFTIAIVYSSESNILFFSNSYLSQIMVVQAKDSEFLPKVCYLNPKSAEDWVNSELLSRLEPLSLILAREDMGEVCWFPCFLKNMLDYSLNKNFDSSVDHTHRFVLIPIAGIPPTSCIGMQFGWETIQRHLKSENIARGTTDPGY